jgi:hypothetical protein
VRAAHFSVIHLFVARQDPKAPALPIHPSEWKSDRGKSRIRNNDAPSNSLDGSGGSVFLNKTGAEKVE